MSEWKWEKIHRRNIILTYRQLASKDQVPHKVLCMSLYGTKKLDKYLSLVKSVQNFTWLVPLVSHWECWLLSNIQVQNNILHHLHCTTFQALLHCRKYLCIFRDSWMRLFFIKFLPLSVEGHMSQLFSSPHPFPIFIPQQQSRFVNFIVSLPRQIPRSTDVKQFPWRASVFFY